MRSISNAIASSSTKRFVHGNLQGKGNPGTAPSSSFNLCGFRCLGRAFSSCSDDYREKLRNGLVQDLKLDDDVGLLGEMAKSRPLPSIFDFSKLMSAIGKMKKYDVVISLAEKMEMCKASKVEDAWKLFCSLDLKGVKPDVVTCTSMIAGLCRKSLMQDACALFEKMKGDGPLPNSGTYNTLIRAHLRNGDQSASAELIKEMRSCGFSGDASRFGLVTNMLHDGRLDKSFLDMLS